MDVPQLSMADPGERSGELQRAARRKIIRPLDAHAR